MKVFSSIALLLSAGALAVSGYTYQESTKLIKGLGDLAYLSYQPDLRINLDSVKIDFGQYSNKMSGKLKIEVTNKEFPLDKFQFFSKILVKDAGGNVVGENYVRKEIEARSSVIDFKDDYLSNDDGIVPGGVYTYVVDSYSWSPSANELKPVE